MSPSILQHVTQTPNLRTPPSHLYQTRAELTKPCFQHDVNYLNPAKRRSALSHIQHVSSVVAGIKTNAGRR